MLSDLRAGAPGGVASPDGARERALILETKLQFHFKNDCVRGTQRLPGQHSAQALLELQVTRALNSALPWACYTTGSNDLIPTAVTNST